MEIVLNGEKTAVQDPCTLQTLIKQMGLNPAQVAVEVNREIVTRSRWTEHELKAGDQVEVVHFVGGGGEDDVG